MTRVALIVVIVLSSLGNDSESARILGVFPTPSISHQIVFRALTMELSNRGHELVIFTTDPVNNSSLKNYKEIDMHYIYPLMMNHVDNVGASWMSIWYACSEKIVDTVLAHPEMQRIIAPNNTEHFDLILVELLTFEAIYALQNHLNVPMIGITSMPLFLSGHYIIGNEHGLTYTPGLLDPYTDDMDFWLRLYHVCRYARAFVQHHFDNIERQDKLVKKYFGYNMPHTSELGKEISLVFTNTNPVLGYPRPNIPGVIEIGGLRSGMRMKGLEKELKNFLDSATNGFIYFSLGTNAKSEHLPTEKIDTLMSVLASLPYKVLWKWEKDTLPGKSENILLSKWLPQQDVLAHPNIKVFVYQGGLQSTEEAIQSGVPLVGIPIIADQEFNVQRIASAKVGLRVNYEPLSGEELREAIITVITDNSYKKRMLKFRELFNDQINHPMEKAAWWTEYVIRHNGAPHLRTKVRHLTWYQRELLDVLGFVLLAVLLIFYIVYKVISLLVGKLIGSLSAKVKTN